MDDSPDRDDINVDKSLDQGKKSSVVPLVGNNQTRSRMSFDIGSMNSQRVRKTPISSMNWGNTNSYEQSKQTLTYELLATAFEKKDQRKDETELIIEKANNFSNTAIRKYLEQELPAEVKEDMENKNSTINQIEN